MFVSFLAHVDECILQLGNVNVCPQELQKAYDKRKAIVLSINLCSAEFVQPDTEESRELQVKLKDMNNHWDKLGGSLDEWRSSLQEALMQCQVSGSRYLKTEAALKLYCA